MNQAIGEVKIYKLNECDWVAARTLSEAMFCLSKTVSNGVVDDSFKEEFIDAPRVLSDQEMDTLKLGDEDSLEEFRKKHGFKKGWSEEYRKTIPTFREALKDQLKKEKPPFFFASSEW